ncbi:hypothetical protein V8D89_003382 [Ganoderma adspersum]
MSIAITFGAFGDFVSVVDLAMRGLKARGSSRGSSYDYQCLIHELHALKRILLSIAMVVASQDSMGESMINDGLIAEVVGCRDVVEGLWKQVDKFEDALRPGSTRRGPIVWWRKIQSRLDNLLEHVTSSMAVATAQIRELATVVRQPPPQVGYGPPNAITFHDLFGIQTLFPMNLCESRQQFGVILRLLSSKWLAIMQKAIKVDAYHAMCEEPRTLLSSGDSEEKWTSVVVPGRTIRILYGFRLEHWEGGAAPVAVDKLGEEMYVNFVVCPDCEWGSGHRPFYSKHKCQVFVFGCHSEDADWKVSVEVCVSRPAYHHLQRPVT